VARYLIRRLLLIVPTLVGLSILSFTISHVVPADPARLAAGPRATPDMIETIRHEYGLDRPVYAQYLIYVRNLLTGDWGRSIISQHPVLAELRQYFPATLELVLASMAIAIVLGVPLGVLAAVSQNRWPDQLSRIVAISFVSMPRFWFAIILQLTVGLALGLLPISGRLPTLQAPPRTVTGMMTVDSLLAGNLPLFALALRHLILPAFVQAVGAMAIITRTVRGDMLETLGQDFVRTARAKGLSERKVISGHVLRNAFIPTLTMIGLSFGFSLGGSVLVETVFDWPGIGLYAVNAAVNFDFEPIMGVTLLVGFIFVVLNLAVDLLYGVLDPRIRYS
jgi:peptide/nickel transport system permease protein